MNNAVTSEVGTRVLFENDDVRIWDLTLQPGERQGFHKHENDYLLIFVGDSRIRSVNEDGSTRFESDMKDGQCFHRVLPGGQDIHDAVNAGDTPSRNFIIEMKKSKP